MISVFATLRASIFLWLQNFWYLVVITLITQTPVIYLSRVAGGIKPAHGPHPLDGAFVFDLAALFTIFYFGAVNTAAILGLLTRASSGKRVGLAIWTCVKTNTWTFCWLMLLLGFILGLAATPLVYLFKIFNPPEALRVILLAVYLVLIKYALAYPLVVVENMRAGQALQRSWGMTKGRFGYVFGCYLFLWGGLWLIGWLLPKLVGKQNGADFVVHLIFALFDSLWIVLSWCMYLRIKAADQSPEEPLAEPIPAA